MIPQAYSIQHKFTAYRDPSHIPNNSCFGVKLSNSLIISACSKPNRRHVCTHIYPIHLLHAYDIIDCTQLSNSFEKVPNPKPPHILAQEISTHCFTSSLSISFVCCIPLHMLCKPYPMILLFVHNLYHIYLIFKPNNCALSPLGMKMHLQTFSI